MSAVTIRRGQSTPASSARKRLHTNTLEPSGFGVVPRDRFAADFEDNRRPEVLQALAQAAVPRRALLRQMAGRAAPVRTRRGG